MVEWNRSVELPGPFGEVWNESAELNRELDELEEYDGPFHEFLLELNAAVGSFDPVPLLVVIGGGWLVYRVVVRTVDAWLVGMNFRIPRKCRESRFE